MIQIIYITFQPNQIRLFNMHHNHNKWQYKQFHHKEYINNHLFIRLHNNQFIKVVYLVLIEIKWVKMDNLDEILYIKKIIIFLLSSIFISTIFHSIIIILIFLILLYL